MLPIKRTRSILLLVTMLFANLTFAHGHLKQATQALSSGDYTGAATLFAAIADDGDAEARYQLALLLSSGRGIDANEDKSTEYMQMAASQGHEEAIDWLTERGIETEANPEDDC